MEVRTFWCLLYEKNKAELLDKGNDIPLPLDILQITNFHITVGNGLSICDNKTNM